MMMIAAKPVPASPTPVTLVFIVPSSYTPAYDPDQASLVVQEWAARTQAWYARETGKTVDIEYFYIHSVYTLQDMQGAAEVDACGMGADWERVPNRVVMELANRGKTYTLPNRLWIVMAGAGGWAGGLWYGMNPDAGRMLVGDWAIQYRLTGSVPPCDADGTESDGGTFGHETLNAMGASPYDPVLWLDSAFTAEQRRLFLRHNKAFLRSP